MEAITPTTQYLVMSPMLSRLFLLVMLDSDASLFENLEVGLASWFDHTQKYNPRMGSVQIAKELTTKQKCL